jgi:hypothetical protein
MPRAPHLTSASSTLPMRSSLGTSILNQYAPIRLANAPTQVRPTSPHARLIGMTNPGDSGERPQPEPEAPSGRHEPPPIEQAHGQPNYSAQPGSTPPQGPPVSGYPPPAYPQPPATSYPSGYPPPSYPPPSYSPPPGGYPPPLPYQSSYSSTPYTGGYLVPQSRTNGMAIGSVVASIVGAVFLLPSLVVRTGQLSWILLFFIGDTAAIVGVVLGVVALNQIKQTSQRGRGLAIAGIAVGAAVLVISAIGLLLLWIYAASRW